MYTVFKTHRRVNAPVEFKGLKGQYILYAGGVVIGSMILFAILYIVGVNSYLCLFLCFGIGISGISRAYHLSQRYGVYGRQATILYRNESLDKFLDEAILLRNEMTLVRASVSWTAENERRMVALLESIQSIIFKIYEQCKHN
jgi:uncharacterized membrane protein YccC